jgi:hypothetical protein
MKKNKKQTFNNKMIGFFCKKKRLGTEESTNELANQGLSIIAVRVRDCT